MRKTKKIKYEIDSMLKKFLIYGVRENARV